MRKRHLVCMLGLAMLATGCNPVVAKIAAWFGKSGSSVSKAGTVVSHGVPAGTAGRANSAAAHSEFQLPHGTKEVGQFGLEYIPQGYSSENDRRR